ncbi:hypothetical protein FACS189487_01510 [Campylobacterota bacterium]|nr:hypothetical protein FACS189487_01510 [Campylobacterota bacterium]
MKKLIAILKEKYSGVPPVIWREAGKYLIDASKIILGVAILSPIFKDGVIPAFAVFVAAFILLVFGLYCVKEGA